MTTEIIQNSNTKDFMIYQVWSGDLRPGCRRSSELVKKYAERIGADYRLDIDPNIASATCDVPMYFEWLNPMLDDSFMEYGSVCVLDMDIFPVENLEEHIFGPLAAHHDFAICDEPFQGRYRASTTIGGHINSANDEKWAALVEFRWGKAMPRDDEGYVKVYNAGNVIFSNKGMQLMRDQFVPFQEYIDYMRSNNMGRFYTVDQNYFHAMMWTHADHAHADGSTVYQMDRGWNDYVHYVRGPLGITTPIHDPRDADTKFVHIQLSGADMFDADKLDRITNLSQGQWEL